MVNFEAGVRSSRLAFALAALSTAAAVHAQPLRLYVDDDAPAGGDGRLWSRAFGRVQDALLAARSRANPSQPVEIRVAQGTYRAQAGTGGSAAFVLTSGVSLLGGFSGVAAVDPNQADPASFVTVLTGDVLGNDTSDVASRADNARTVVAFGPQCGTLSGMTISGGSTAVSTSFTRAVISDCRITDNITTSGSGARVVHIDQGYMSNCTIDGNQVSGEPLMYVSQAVVERCVIAGNRRLDPAGSALGFIYGGGVSGQPSRFESCLIAANNTLSNQLFQLVTLLGCTVVDNRSASGVGTIAAENTIFSGNQPNIVSGGNSMVRHCLFDISGQAIGSFDVFNVFGNPRFVSRSGPDGDPLTWRDNDYRLTGASPAIDIGITLNPAYAVPTFGLLGRPPIDDPLTLNLGVGPVAYLDIGAYEFDPSTRCLVDVDSSGVADAADIFAFLNLWFAGAPGADFNSTGTLNVLDIIDFLNAWFNGC